MWFSKKNQRDIKDAFNQKVINDPEAQGELHRLIGVTLAGKTG